MNLCVSGNAEPELEVVPMSPDSFFDLDIHENDKQFGSIAECLW